MGTFLPVVNIGGPAWPVVLPPFTYEPLSPARLLDTRASGQTVDGQFRGGGPRPGGSTLELQVTGRAGVPATASAAVLNVTVSGATRAGFVTAFPCGTARPNASNLNYRVGQTVPNLVIAKIGQGGKVCLYVEGATQLIADITGYQPFHTAYGGLSPARLLDTRGSGATVDGQFQRGGVRASGSTLALQVAGRGGVPTTATSVVLNVTVSGATAAGFVTVFPCGTTRPNASNLNYTAGQTVPNLVIAKIGQNGQVCLYVERATQLIADVAGTFPPNDPFVGLAPARLLDTRSSGQTVDGQQRGGGPRAAGTTLEVQVTQRGGVPAGASAVVLNVTATGATRAGFVTVFPCGQPRPNASNLNYTAGQTVPNLVISRVGANGRVCFYTESATNLIADVTGAY